MSQRRLTPGYIIFYVLFSPETWRVLFGIIGAYFLIPVIIPANIGKGGQAMLYIMTATVGYSLFGAPARWIARMLKQVILGDRQP